MHAYRTCHTDITLSYWDAYNYRTCRKLKCSQDTPADADNNMVLSCSAGWKENCSECLALLEGLFLAEKCGWSSVTITSDSVEAVWALQTGSSWDTVDFS
ncbi:hypothetical protein QQ045_017927 [Rhodiola kirilowii]